jgi:polysaccharide export outer membrane protein
MIPRSIALFAALTVLGALAATAVEAASRAKEAPPAETPAVAEIADYHLGVGDTVSIAVFGEPDLSQQAKIGESGRISYPFIGDIRVIGLTVRQLETELVRQLKGNYLVNPQVSVAVSQYRPFFINGQVKSPGSYPFQPGMTVRKAVSIAGGLAERASERRILLIPESNKDSKQGRNVSLDDPIGPGDIITVEESFF